MKRCLITGLKTNNQWKRKYIHPIALKRAKRDLDARGRFSSFTLRDCVQKLAKKFKEYSSHEFPDDSKIDIEKYVNFINDFFLDDIEDSK